MAQADIDRLLAAAQAADAAGQAAVAVRHCEAVLAQDAANPQALNMLGLLALSGGDPARAAAMLRLATQADPSAPMLWLNLSSAQRQLEDHGGERASLTAALDLDPYSLAALVRKAQLHERLGEEAQATSAWTNFLSAVPPETQQPPPLRAIVVQAQAYVESRSARFAAALDAALDPERARVDGAERRRFDAAVDHVLGKRAIYTPKCAGLHYPFLPADEFFPAALFPWFAELEARTPAIRADLQALLADGGEGVEAYVNQPAGARPNQWTPLNRTRAWGAYYFWHYGARRDAACERFPATAAACAAIPHAELPGRAPTAFFSLLEPGARIPPHTGVTNTRCVVHLPLIVPADCAFRVGGETREWVEGRAFAFDDTIEHEAWNNSAQVRGILILDAWNPYLTEIERGLVRAFYVAADASGLNPEAEGVR